jgi:uncharacterized protein VirK/YbjX
MRQITIWNNLAGIPLSPFYFRELAKLAIRASLYPKQTRRWLKFLNSNPALKQLTWACPKLASKLYHPYLNDKMSCREIVSVLSTHYQFMLQLGFGALLVRAAQRRVTLCEIEGKYGSAYQIQLSAVAPMEREGDLLLQLTSGDRTIYSVAFSFFRQGREMAVGIGCIQGPNGEKRLECVRTTTRDFYGLRPKTAMVYLVRQLGYEFGCKDIFLVGNINRAADYALRKQQVYADYDSLWIEMGATRMPNGDFVLSCGELDPLDMQMIPSKKRSEAKKRHDMLGALCDSLKKNLNLQRVKSTSLH